MDYLTILSKISFNEYILIPAIVAISLPLILYYFFYKLTNNNDLPVPIHETHITNSNNIHHNKTSVSKIKKKKHILVKSVKNITDDHDNINVLQTTKVDEGKLGDNTESSGSNNEQFVKTKDLEVLEDVIIGKEKEVIKKKDKKRKNKPAKAIVGGEGKKDDFIFYDFEDEDQNTESWNYVGGSKSNNKGLSTNTYNTAKNVDDSKKSEPEPSAKEDHVKVPESFNTKQEIIVVQEKSKVINTLDEEEINKVSAPVVSQKVAISLEKEDLLKKKKDEIEILRKSMDLLAMENGRLKHDLTKRHADADSESRHKIDFLSNELSKLSIEADTLRKEKQRFDASKNDLELRLRDANRLLGEKENYFKQYTEQELNRCQQNFNAVLNSVKAEVSERDETIAGLRNHIDQNKNKQSQMTDSLKDSEGKIWELKEEMNKLGIEIDAQRQKNNELSCKNEESNITLETELRKIKDVNRSLMENVNVSEERIGEYKAEAETLQSKCHQLQEEVHEKTLQVNQVITEKNSVENELNQCRANGQFEEGMESKFRALEEVVKAKTCELEKNVHENNNLKLELNKCRERSDLVEALQSKCSQLEGEISQRKGTWESVLQENNALKIEVTQACGKRDEVQNICDIQEGKLDDAMTSLKNADVSMSEWSVKVAVLGEELHLTKTECDRLKQKVLEDETEIDKISQENASLKADMAEKEEQLRGVLNNLEVEVEGERQRLKDENATLEQRLSESMQEVERMREETHTQCSTIEELHRRMGELGEERKAFGEELAAQQEELQKEKSNLQTTINELSNELNANKEEHGRLLNGEKQLKEDYFNRLEEQTRKVQELNESVEYERKEKAIQAIELDRQKNAIRFELMENQECLAEANVRLQRQIEAIEKQATERLSEESRLLEEERRVGSETLKKVEELEALLSQERERVNHFEEIEKERSLKEKGETVNGDNDYVNGKGGDNHCSDGH